MPKSSSLSFPNTSGGVIKDSIFPYKSHLDGMSRGDNPHLMVSLMPSGQTHDFSMVSLFWRTSVLQACLVSFVLIKMVILHY